MPFDPLAQSRLRALRPPLLLSLVSPNIMWLTELANADRKRAPRFGMPTRAASLDMSRMSIYEGLLGSLLPTILLPERAGILRSP